MAWTPRDVKDMVVQYPNRFKIDGVSHTIEPDFGIVTEPGTPINKEFLQPIEDFLATVDLFEIGSYTGTGTSGSGNKNTLTFDFVPRIIIIIADSISLIGNYAMILLQGSSWSMGYGSNSSGGVGVAQYYRNAVTWIDDGKTVQWHYSFTSPAAEYQMNASGIIYRYIAIG